MLNEYFFNIGSVRIESMSDPGILSWKNPEGLYSLYLEPIKKAALKI